MKNSTKRNERAVFRWRPGRGNTAGFILTGNPCSINIKRRIHHVKP